MAIPDPPRLAPLDLVRMGQALRVDASALTDDLNAANFAVHQVLMEALRPGRAVGDAASLRAQVRARLLPH